MSKFVQRQQSQLYLLPPDLRDWLPEDDLAHPPVPMIYETTSLLRLV